LVDKFGAARYFMSVTISTKTQPGNDLKIGCAARAGELVVAALVMTVAVEVTQPVLQMVEAEAVPDISTQREVH
jgi:hypothetical protein